MVDSNNNRIRKITPDGIFFLTVMHYLLYIVIGNVITIAGNDTKYTIDGIGTTAAFNRPYGIAIDQSSAEIYVSEQAGNVIRKIMPQGFRKKF